MTRVHAHGRAPLRMRHEHVSHQPPHISSTLAALKSAPAPRAYSRARSLDDRAPQHACSPATQTRPNASNLQLQHVQLHCSQCREQTSPRSGHAQELLSLSSIAPRSQTPAPQDETRSRRPVSARATTPPPATRAPSPLTPPAHADARSDPPAPSPSQTRAPEHEPPPHPSRRDDAPSKPVPPRDASHSPRSAPPSVV